MFTFDALGALYRGSVPRFLVRDMSLETGEEETEISKSLIWVRKVTDSGVATIASEIDYILQLP